MSPGSRPSITSKICQPVMSSSLCFFRRYAGSPQTCLACPVAVGSIYPVRLGNQAIA
jgi:hypothetical protein